MAGVVIASQLGPYAWPCSLDLERLLAGGKRRRLCGELKCLECGRDALVLEVGAAIAVLQWPHLDHDSIVVTLHGMPANPTPEEVGEVTPVIGRVFEYLNGWYARLDFWWVIEQSATGVVNIHALTIGRRPARADRIREAFAEARDLGLGPVFSSQPVRHPTRIACYAAKVALYSLLATDSRDAQDVLNYALVSGAGRFAHHTPGFFGGREEPWTPQQMRRRGLHRAPRVLRWVDSYPSYHEKLPPRLVERLRNPPRGLNLLRGTDGAGSEEFVLDADTARLLIEGLDL